MALGKTFDKVYGKNNRSHLFPSEDFPEPINLADSNSHVLRSPFLLYDGKCGFSQDNSSRWSSLLNCLFLKSLKRYKWRSHLALPFLSVFALPTSIWGYFVMDSAIFAFIGSSFSCAFFLISHRKIL